MESVGFHRIPADSGGWPPIPVNFHRISVETRRIFVGISADCLGLQPNPSDSVGFLRIPAGFRSVGAGGARDLSDSVGIPSESGGCQFGSVGFRRIPADFLRIFGELSAESAGCIQSQPDGCRNPRNPPDFTDCLPGSAPIRWNPSDSVGFSADFRRISADCMSPKGKIRRISSDSVGFRRILANQKAPASDFVGFRRISRI